MAVKRIYQPSPISIMNALKEEIAKRKDLELLATIDNYMLIVKSEKISVNIVNNNNFFQPFEKVIERPICELIIILVGIENQIKSAPPLFKRLMEMNCSKKVIRLIETVPQMIKEI